MQSGYHIRKRFACAFSSQGNGSLQFGPSEPRDSSQEEECYCLVLLTNRESLFLLLVRRFLVVNLNEGHSSKALILPLENSVPFLS